MIVIWKDIRNSFPENDIFPKDIYIYIYIYIQREKERERDERDERVSDYWNLY